MSEETNTQETAPSLESFNEPSAPAEPTAKQPAETNPTAGEPKPSDAQKPAEQPKQPEDIYAHIEEGLIIPQGVEVKPEALANLKAIAKQYNVPVDAVKALLQHDLNENARDIMFEQKVLKDAQAKWEQENQTKYGDNLKNVKTDCSRVLAELDKEGKFKELLATAGVSEHPATLGFLKAIGEIVLEKPSVNPNATISTDEEVELENFN